MTKLNRQLLVRLVGVFLLAFLAWMVIQGHAAGAIEVGVRHKSVLLSGGDMWLGYLFYFLSACVTLFLFFLENVQSKTYIVLAAIVGTTWLITLVVCLIVGIDVA
jgi:hypothetical protein